MAIPPPAPTPTPPAIEHVAAPRHPHTDYLQLHFRLTAMFKAPDHHVDACVIENGGSDPEALFLESEGAPLTETAKNLAACLVTPCEQAEENEIRISAAMQRNMYYLSNPDRVGEYIARIRRRKRRQSNPV